MIKNMLKEIINRQTTTGNIMADKNIQLQSIKPEDEEFLYKVYASTREAEMAMVDWTKGEG